MTEFTRNASIRLLLAMVLTMLFPGYPALRAQISDTIDVVHYRIHLDSIDFQQQFLEAEAIISLTPADPSNPLSGITLELLGLDVDSVIDMQGNQLGFTQADTLVRFGLMQTLPYGDTTTISVFYSGSPHVEPYNWGGFHFQGTVYAYNLGVAIADVPHNYGKIMFPCVDDFTDRASYEFLVHAPAGMTGVSNGTLVNVSDHPDGSKTWHWSLEQSIPTYLACVAVSDYIVLSDTFQSAGNSIPTTVHVRQADSANAAQSFVNLVQICELFVDRFGEYRWPRAGYVIAPKGAMEHATCITYPRNTVNGNLTYEYLYAHELAHMWFGDLVTCNSADEMWLNEGWASFAELIYKEGLYGREAMKDYNRKMLRGILQSAHIEENGYRALYGMPLEYTYGSTIYDKGACVAHTLRGYLGDDLFFPAIQAYLDAFAFDDAGSDDLRDILEQETGIQLDDFFDAWVYGPGYPHFRIDSVRVLPPPLPPDYTVKVYISQQGKGTTSPALSNRIGLRFMDEQWQTFDTVIWIPGAEGSADVHVPFYPAHVFIDPEEWICDATTDAFMMINSTGKKIFPDTYFELQVSQVSDSALVRATHHWVPPDSLTPYTPGLRISDYRYWSVNGVWPSGIEGKLRFFYTKFSNLDNGIILDPADSVILLYREGPGQPWTSVPATMEGQTYQGYMVLDTIMRGDFSIGVWDHTYLGGRSPESVEDLILVYPNPSDDSFRISCAHPDAGACTIFSSDGKLVHEDTFGAAGSTITWDARNVDPGIYFLVIENKYGKGIGGAQLVRK